MKAELSVPTDGTLVYSHLMIRLKQRYITSKSCCRSTKRNNSCVIYKEESATVRYGILIKILFSSEQYYALILRLKVAPLLLCQDKITNGKLNDHITAFYPPRYSLNNEFVDYVIMRFPKATMYMYFSLNPSRTAANYIIIAIIYYFGTTPTCTGLIGRVTRVI